MSNGAQHAAGPATYRMLRELGSRAQRSYAAVREPDELLVAQRFVRVKAFGDPAPATAEGATPLDAEAMALLLRDARCLAKNPHPNLARVLHAEVSPAPRRELTVATELIDGSTLADLLDAAKRARTAPALTVSVMARILLDVLAGLAALHALRDGIGLPLGAVHGELCPANIVVGNDGVARVVNALRRRPVTLDAASEAFAYAAPEALASSGTNDPRSDEYAVGAILNEALVGSTPSAFPRLTAVATRALSFEPALRFDDAAEMARALEASAGDQLSSHDAVAALVTELAGARIRSRRGTLVPAVSGTRRRASSTSFSDDNDELPGPRASSPEGPLEGAAALGGTRRVVVTRAALEAISPLTPMVPLAATPEPSPLPPRLPPPPARAPSVPAFPPGGTPGDFVIPIDVTETLNGAAPRRQARRVAVLALAATVIAVAAYVWIGPAFRAAATPPSVAASPPPAAAPLPPSAPKAERATATHDVPAIATTPAARPSASADASAGARRAPPLPAPVAPPPKPKRSIYEPDTL
jgi:eukaryotic-like serine/threonine-protein kinase